MKEVLDKTPGGFRLTAEVTKEAKKALGIAGQRFRQLRLSWLQEAKR